MRGRGTVTLLRKGLEAGEMKGNYETALKAFHNRKRDQARKEEIGAGAGNQVRVGRRFAPLFPTYLIDSNGYDIRQISFNVVNFFFWPLPCTM